MIYPSNPSATPRTAWWLLILVMLLAGLLRFADLGNCPAGLFRDEAEKGYNAWALATSGGAVDFSGGLGSGPTVQWRRLPWMINVMGGKTSAIYQYASIPFVGLGGLSVATTRLASAFIGTLTVALLGALLMRAWGFWPGLAAALWLALSPWHLVFSRWALEGIFVPFFITLALAGLWGLERQRRWAEPLTAAALGWLFYSYSGAQPFVLAWGLCLLLLYRRHVRPRQAPFWLGLILFLIPVIPTVMVRLEPGGSLRLERIALWSEPGLSTGRLAGRFCLNYLAHFDPRFLFWSGDRLPRHGIPGMGQLVLLDALLLPLGLVLTLRRRVPLAGALLAVFLCAPLPAAITRIGIPHALRSFAMVLPATAWSGWAIVAITRWIVSQIAATGVPGKRRQARLVAAGFIAVCLLAGLSADARYWRLGHSAPEVQVAFENGARHAWETLAREKQPGQRVFINGYIPYAPYYQIFFLKLPARDLNPQALEKGGFIYFNPEQLSPDAILKHMAPGDWLLQPIRPEALTDPAGDPWITPAQAALAGEAWVMATRK